MYEAHNTPSLSDELQHKLIVTNNGSDITRTIKLLY